jgi:hypothetical protein
MSRDVRFRDWPDCRTATPSSHRLQTSNWTNTPLHPSMADPQRSKKLPPADNGIGIDSVLTSHRNSAKFGNISR